MTQRLAGRTAFINGGASGIGRAGAIRLAAEGASVWITGRDPVTLDEALEQQLVSIAERTLGIKAEGDPEHIQSLDGPRPDILPDDTIVHFGGPR